MQPIPEPYKIKTCEPIVLISRKERATLLKKAHFNPMLLPADKIYIDLITDSGTGALSSQQWAEIVTADEAFAYQTSYFKLMEVARTLFPFKYILIFHQGRMAEHILLKYLVEKDKLVISNTLFDITRENINFYGGKGIDMPGKLGNINLDKLKTFIKKENASQIAFVLLTITNNNRAGLPISLKNVKECNKLLSKYNIPLWIDGSRFSENVYFIKEKEYPHKSIRKLTKELFSYVDGFMMSAKKSGLSSVGGLVGTNDKKLASQLEQFALMIDGYPSHGGMSGRDIAAMAQGLIEAVDEELLKFRMQQLRWFGSLFQGIPIVKPIGSHAVYIKADKFLPHLKKDEFPAMALAGEVWLEGSIRGAAWGDYYRLAIPRRVYTQSHLEYVADVVKKVFKRRNKIKGLKSTYLPGHLAVFNAKFTRQ